MATIFYDGTLTAAPLPPLIERGNWHKAATPDCAQKKCLFPYADGEGLGDNQLESRRKMGSIAFLLRTVKGKPCGWLGYSLRLLLPKGQPDGFRECVGCE